MYSVLAAATLIITVCGCSSSLPLRTDVDLLLREKSFPTQCNELSDDHLIRMTYIAALPQKGYSYVLKIRFSDHDNPHFRGARAEVKFRSGDGKFIEGTRELSGDEIMAVAKLLYREEILSLPQQQKEIPGSLQTSMALDAGTLSFEYFSRKTNASVKVVRTRDKSEPVLRVFREVGNLLDDLVSELERQQAKNRSTP